MCCRLLRPCPLAAAPLCSLLALLLAAGCASAPQRQEVLRLWSPADAPHAVDPNGFLFNPRWYGVQPGEIPSIEERCRFRVATGHLDRRSLVVSGPGCLSDEERRIVTLNEAIPTLVLGAVCVTGGKTGNVRGHVNWFPVTATGLIRWKGFSSGIADHDLTFEFLTPTPNAVTQANLPGYFDGNGGRSYHLEFYYEETLERLPDRAGGFWRLLRSAMTQNDSARKLIDDRFAIITGVYGVDGVHSFHAELHPVFGMTVLVDTTRIGNRMTEHWAVMARNLGSEGDCSSGTLPLLTSRDTDVQQDYIVDLGSFVDGAVPRVTVRESWSSDDTFHPWAEVRSEAGGTRRRVYLHIPHPRPRPGEDDFLFLGTIELERSAPESQGWGDRLASWVPEGLRPRITTTRDTRVMADWAMRVNPELDVKQTVAGTAGYSIERSRLPILEQAPPADIVRAEATPAPPGTRAGRTPGWPLADTVRLGCAERARQDPICLSASRWTVGPTWANRVGWGISFGYFVFPHSGTSEKQTVPAKVLNAVRLLGYRFDARVGRAIPVVRRDSIQIREPERMVYALRVSPFISPEAARIGEHVTLSPYTIGNFGLSWIDGSKPRLTGGWGIGMQFQISGHDFIAETQRMSRKGLESQWALSFAWLWPFRGAPGRRQP